MILNLRGSSCSGKSTNVYNLLRDHPYAEVWETEGWNKAKPKCVGHVLPGNLFIAGPYQPTAKTGGMDMLMPGKTELTTLWLERKFDRFDHVIFESLMASLAIGRYQDMAVRCDHQGVRALPYAFMFMDTPLELCRERLLARNGGHNREGKPLNLEATCDHSWNRMQVIRQRFVADGRFLVYDLDHRQSYPQVVALLRQQGWDHSPSTVPATYESPPEDTLAGIIRGLREGHGWPDDPKRITRLEKELTKHGSKVP